MTEVTKVFAIFFFEWYWIILNTGVQIDGAVQVPFLHIVLGRIKTNFSIEAVSDSCNKNIIFFTV